MDEELKLFKEDMDEQLSIMEDTIIDMMELSIEEIDTEMINKLFRAMHTMKGNASMFGFDTVVSFAHVAENLLDEIRNSKITLTPEMIELFLIVNDHSKTLIDVTLQNEELDDEQKEQHDYLLEQLNSFLGSSKDIVENESSSGSYFINITIKDSFLNSDMDLFSIIKYLNVIGEVSNLEVDYNNIPDLESLDVKKSYLKISFEYIFEEAVSEIESAFEYVKDDIELSIVDKNRVVDIKEEQIDTVFEKKQEIKKETKAKKTKKDSASVNKNKSYSLRVDSSKVDQLINLISEMVIANAKITQIANNDDNTELQEATDTMTTMLEEIRANVMEIRMVQVGSSLNKLRRIVNDTAKKLGKDIEFVISGEDTELDKSVVEKISDPLVHMLRNSIDHGIEPKEVRIANNKDPKGRIDLRAYPDAGSIVIEIEDDGAGIPKDIILAKAIENSLVSANDNLTDKEIYNLIFAAGLSSAKEVSDISGRGVGMDVVKKNIEELKGSVEVDSKPGVGSKFTINLPLTLAIIDGFLVQVGETKYIIPLDMVNECIELTKEHKKMMKNNEFINLRGSILPLIDAVEYFEVDKKESERENIIIVSSTSQRAGLIVNELLGEFQTVIKPLGEVFENVPFISGGTILGSGEVALILDVPMLLKHFK